jgi:hypothetical protein
MGRVPHGVWKEKPPWKLWQLAAGLQPRQGDRGESAQARGEILAGAW